MLTCLEGVGGGQKALSKIAAKQYLRLLMMLDFDAYLWGGCRTLFKDNREGMFQTLDDS